MVKVESMKAKQINKWLELTWARNLSQPARHLDTLNVVIIIILLIIWMLIKCNLSAGVTNLL